MVMSYETYTRGLRMIVTHGYDVLRPCRTRADWELARTILASLESATIGAGGNTWREAKDRYEHASHVFSQLPTPCEATLCHVAERCSNVGHGGVCDKCSETIVSVMHRTCRSYGIAIPYEHRRIRK